MNLQTKGLTMKLHKPLYFKNKILNLKMCGGIFFFFKLAGNVHALAHPKGLVAFLPLKINKEKKQLLDQCGVICSADNLYKS